MKISAYESSKIGDLKKELELLGINPCNSEETITFNQIIIISQKLELSGFDVMKMIAVINSGR